MRKITITGLCNLLKNMSYIPLLPYQRIHQPLSNLLDIFCDSLRNKYKNKSESGGEKNDVDSSEEIEEDEFMGLLDTITIKLQEVPNGIHFFIKPPASASSPFPASYFSLFDCLLLYFRLHSPNGERARASILRILHSISPPDPQIISYIISTDFIPQIVFFLISFFAFLFFLYFLFFPFFSPFFSGKIMRIFFIVPVTIINLNPKLWTLKIKINRNKFFKNISWCKLLGNKIFY